MIQLNNTRLKEIRENSEISQRQLVKELNISKSTYSRWETEEQIIPLTRLNDFCNKFNVSMDYVMKLSNTNKITNNIDKLDRKLIGTKIKQIRKENNLTQQDLAGFLNTTHSTISAYESGKTLILTAFALEICKKYNYSLDWLCDKRKE